MQNKETRLEMGKKAYNTALNQTWEKMTQEVLKVYEEFLK
jgi:glycosyltransferase involved in cell wall biosynthesis